MKIKIILLILVLGFTQVHSQSEFTKNFDFNSTNCKFPDSERAREIFPLGIASLEFKSYTGAALQIFTEVIEIDTTFCDAYYWAAYTIRQSNLDEKYEFTFFAAADSLSQKPSFEFKQNLASASIKVGRIDIARKKYEEIVNNFPESPEGYYGIALTSTMIGDVDYGLENIELANKKYHSKNKDTQFLKAILLTLNEKYEESLPLYKIVKSKFSRNDQFNGNYALSLYELATLRNDEKMLKQAKKHYKKVKNKNELTDEMRERFEK